MTFTHAGGHRSRDTLRFWHCIPRDVGFVATPETVHVIKIWLDGGELAGPF
jgi:hypothetical protein